MKSYDVIEALGDVKDEYVTEAEQELLNKRKRRKAGVGRFKGIRLISKIAAACLLLLVLPTVTVLAADYFSSIKGDELAFERVEYRGDGIVAIQVRNDSDKQLEFQEAVKLCTFYGNEEIPQIDGGSVKMEGRVIAPHSSSELIIDLSEVYDMSIADKPIQNDWYYLVLTNENFVFGQDWHCSIDFQKPREAACGSSSEVRGNVRDGAETLEELEEITAEAFLYENWEKPTEEFKISSYYGAQENGADSDHINIAGNLGDNVFAVDAGVVLKTGFEQVQGNYVILQLEDGVQVKYGHLQEISVTENQEVKGGEIIGTIGKSGMATGPNLAFTVYVDGENVNPIVNEE